LTYSDKDLINLLLWEERPPAHIRATAWELEPGG